MLSFASCADRRFLASEFTVSETSSPSIDYNGQSNTTAITLSVSVTNKTEFTLEGLSFFAQFRDSDGNILDSRICNFDNSLTAGASRSVSYYFTAADISEASVIKGRVASVTYLPYSIKIAGSGSSSVIVPEEEPLDGSLVFMLVLCVIFCVGVIVTGIVFIVVGANDMEDWLITFGISLIVPTVVIGITLIFLI